VSLAVRDVTWHAPLPDGELLTGLQDACVRHPSSPFKNLIKCPPEHIKFAAPGTAVLHTVYRDFPGLTADALLTTVSSQTQPIMVFPMPGMYIVFELRTNRVWRA